MKKIIFCYLSIGFILNFIWEMSQAGLYQPHFQGGREFLIVHLKATFGDVFMLLVVYLVVGLICRNMKWIVAKKNRPYVLLTFLGFVFAIIIEKLALSIGRWEYNELMPIIPFIDVGIVPVLQLSIIVPLSIFLATRYFKQKDSKIRIKGDLR